MFMGLDTNSSNNFNLLAFSVFIVVFDLKFRDFKSQYLYYLFN
jgi:hypothetical protein